MECATVVKLNAVGPQGQEWLVVVDPSGNRASLLMVTPNAGNIVVRDVQDLTKRGV